MTPKFTAYQDGDSSYELQRSGQSSFYAEYSKSKDDWGVDFREYPPGYKSFIPCPFCNESGAAFTFRFSESVGTNTSGGIETIIYEVKCPRCRIFSVFGRQDTTYPYD